MGSTAQSLFLIALCAAIAPLLAGVVPRRLVPEVVLLLGLGMLVGPHGWELAGTPEGVEVLRELGLGMLFLLAGYEIKVSELTGRGGRRALLTWLVCLGCALAIVLGLDRFVYLGPAVALAIALTSTALGTLLPILKDAGLLHTRVGATVLHHGAVGELGPVVAMAVLLGSRGTLDSILVLGLFALAAVVVGYLSTRVRPESGLGRVIQAGSDTTAQTGLRLVVLLLGGLMALTIVFQLEVVLGAFAAGFVLRRVLPRGDEALELKMEGLAFGLLIPCFFVASGMGIDPRAVADRPLLLLGFLSLILLVRGCRSTWPPGWTDPVTAGSSLPRPGQSADRAVQGRRITDHCRGHFRGGAQRADGPADRLLAGGRRGHHDSPASVDGDPARCRALRCGTGGDAGQSARSAAESRAPGGGLDGG